MEGRWLRRPEFADVVAPVLVVRAVVLALGGLTGRVYPDAPTGLPDPLRVWYWWDTSHYLDIARYGYVATADPDVSALAAFFPLFPALIRIVSLALPPLVAAMSITLAATLAASYGLYRLVMIDGGDRAMARRAVLALNLFPTSFALVAPYSESVFLALSIWSILAARIDRWPWAGVFGMLAGLARVQGWLLGPVLLVEHFARHRIAPPMAWAFAVALAPLTWLAINQVAYGDPLFFVTIEREHFFHYFQPPWEVVTGLISGTLAQNRDLWPMLFLAPLVAFVVLALVGVWSVFSRRSCPAYAAYVLLALLALMSVSWPISAPRYVGALFPVFIALADVGRRRPIWLTSMGGSAVLLLVFTVIFVRGGWAF